MGQRSFRRHSVFLTELQSTVLIMQWAYLQHALNKLRFHFENFTVSRFFPYPHHLSALQWLLCEHHETVWSGRPQNKDGQILHESKY